MKVSLQLHIEKGASGSTTVHPCLFTLLVSLNTQKPDIIKNTPITHAANMEDTVANIRHLAEQQLRKDFPYIKTSSLKKMLDKVATSLQHDLHEQ